MKSLTLFVLLGLGIGNLAQATDQYCTRAEKKEGCYELGGYWAE